MNTTISMESSIYTLGYKTANLTTADDDDWYKVNLTKGISIFADIRNIGSSNYNMQIFYKAADGTNQFYSTEQAVFNRTPEKYLTFSAPVTGTYYIKIYSLGDLEKMNYYFYIGPKLKQLFNINLSLGGTQIWGSSYQRNTINLVKYFPSGAKTNTVSLTNTLSNGNTLAINKMLQI